MEPRDDRLTAAGFARLSRKVLEFQVTALYPFHVRTDPIRSDLISLNHDRNLSSFLTIQYLVEHERVPDIYTISRSMFESVLSMGLLAKRLVPNDVERYQEFQFPEINKTYSHLQRLGLETLSGVPAGDPWPRQARANGKARYTSSVFAKWHLISTSNGAAESAILPS